jgi:hypothetical protein
MPALTGIIADRWINAKIIWILHILSGLLFFIYRKLNPCIYWLYFGYDVLYAYNFAI